MQKKDISATAAAVSQTLITLITRSRLEKDKRRKSKERETRAQGIGLVLLVLVLLASFIIVNIIQRLLLLLPLTSEVKLAATADTVPNHPTMKGNRL